MKLLGEKILRPDMMGPRSAETPVPEASAEAVSNAKPIGLGDWVYGWAHPIAVKIDQATKHLPTRCQTKLSGCSACSHRRRWLNALVPDVRPWKWGWRGACKRVAVAVQRWVRQG